MSEARLNYWLEKVGSKGHWESHSNLSSVPIRLGQVVLSPSRFSCIYCLLPLACSAGVFFERAICSRKHYVETSRRERRWGESKGAGREKRKRCIFFLPSSLSFFRSRTYRKGYSFYSPQSSTVIKSMMVATTILRTRTRFRPPKIRLHCRLYFLRLITLCGLCVSGHVAQATVSRNTSPKCFDRDSLRRRCAGTSQLQV